jgi:prolyl oligopeptidase
MAQSIYPKTIESTVTDTFFNTVVPDPYRWMENHNDTLLKNWLNQQKTLATKERESYKGFWKTYSDISRLSEASYSNVFKKGQYYFALRIENRHSKPALYYAKSRYDLKLQLLLRPDELGTRNENFSIAEVEISEDNHFLAILASESGSDWRTVFIYDMLAHKLLAERVDWLKFSSVQWKNGGFFYKRYAAQSKYSSPFAPSVGATLCYHKLHTPVSSDILVFQPDNTSDDFDFTGTSENKYLFLSHTLHKKGKTLYALSFLYADSVKEQNANHFLLHHQCYKNIPIGCIDDSVVVYTNKSASNHCIQKYAIHELNRGSTLIEEHHENLTSAYVVGSKLFCIYYKDARYLYAVFDNHGKLLTTQRLPDGNSIENVSFSKESDEVIFYKSSFTYPAVVYSLQLSTLKLSPINECFVNYNVDQFESVSTTYSASDSVLIPLYLIYKKGIKLNGKNPTILYGYGGFGVTQKPFFDPMFIDFMLDGGVIAVAGIRGGGEYGTAWHDAGKHLNKQRSFDDFINATEYLFEKNYTNPSKLVLMGGSNGGLLVGAVITQRPDLCKAAILSAGVYDMTRFHLYTVGQYHLSEFGDIRDSVDFKNLMNYSPLHKIKPGITYPSSLILTGDNDDRVPPFQSYKFLAALQKSWTSAGHSYILYIVDQAGHQLGEQFDERTYEKAYIRAFINKQLFPDK